MVLVSSPALPPWRPDTPKTPDYLELYTLYELQSGRGGAALQAILKAFSDPSKTLIELRNKVLAHYGWQHLLWDEEIPSLFPATHALF
eukprot:m.92917 g.92917  ORF g.92917 m.92917 type:complete len:88 (+) comp13785_c0_seq2:3-266(+)